MSVQVWPAKDPDEIVPVSFDFTDELSGASISSNTITVAVREGEDAAVATMIIGASQEADGIVSQMIGFGLDRVYYGFRCRAVLSDNRALVRGAILPVRWAA